jgi:hypothetical protein
MTTSTSFMRRFPVGILDAENYLASRFCEWSVSF